MPSAIDIPFDLIARAFASGDKDRARQLLQQNQDIWNNTPTANLQSHLGGVTTDPRYEQAQNNALQMMMERATKGGMTPEDLAKTDQANDAGAALAHGLQGQAMDQMQERGMGGSGMEMAGVLQGAQAGADRTHKGDVQSASDASTRALEAMRAGAGMAGQMRGQQYNERSNAAQAQDSIDRFNRSDIYNLGDRRAGANTAMGRFALGNAYDTMNQAHSYAGSIDGDIKNASQAMAGGMGGGSALAGAALGTVGGGGGGGQGGSGDYNFGGYNPYWG